MTTIQAIDLMKGLEQSLDDYCELNDEGKTAFRMAIAALELFGISEQLPSVQSEKRTEERTKTHACDLIDRQAAIDALHMHLMYRMGTDSNKKRLDEWINNLPSAQPEQQWIPCSERLPKEEKKTYWVCTDTEYQCECRWTNNRFGIGEGEWGWSIFDTPQYTKPIAWMPLPEPYREDGEADG